MADRVELRLEGADSIARKLRELTDRETHNALRGALRRGAHEIRKRAVSGAKRFDDPATAEVIAKNIAVRSGGVRRERSLGGVMVRIGVLGGAKKLAEATGAPGGDTWYWRLLEFGTSRMRAQPFMRPAMQAGAQPAIDRFSRLAAREIEKVVAKR